MPVVRYSLYRLALLGACFGLLAWVGFRDWLLAVVAVLVALLASQALLRGPRDAAALHVAQRAARRREAAGRPSRDEQAEDAEAS